MLVRFFLIVSLLSWSAFGQTKIKRVTASPTDKTSGSEMFRVYCSPCHGLEGKGDGPAAPALKKQPVDLSLLSKKNNGKFPAGLIHTTLNEVGSPAHGSREMPIWGDVFRSLEHDSTGVSMRIMNLSKYIETLQR